ncbi:sulfur carrier protein ThiS [Sinimarinibacterium sp. NLF-5-8]|uniref:sulfur carrier protein ThiS n=1 Tax=Sinimarinibacterium sp. NLF-5-8 TaxID=2698684 RepID=UPI00137BF8ED|nr:sulfur carrier protein ThiS [Sinimarinibacterium sp. NLF-5-8]QHS10965.1 sulfur carrier protein ThiS [Sinimarinibacterium sp. NLF-5-8]
MHITVNGEPHALDQPLTLTQLIDQLDLGARRIAVELNGEIVPRTFYPQTLLQNEDELLIVHAIGGG